MSKSILLSNSTGPFGLATAVALAQAGHKVYAGTREIDGPRNRELSEMARRDSLDLRMIELDVLSQPSVDAAVDRVVAEVGRLDVLVHNSGYMMSGPAKAFTADQLAHLYDMNVLSTQCVNRAVLPQLRQQGRGLIIWVSSISSSGLIPPYLAPYFTTASMDSIAATYAQELANAGIDCCTVMPRSTPREVDGDCDNQATAGHLHVAGTIVEIVGLPAGRRLLRVFVQSGGQGLEATRWQHCRLARAGTPLRPMEPKVIPIRIRSRRTDDGPAPLAG
jgi:NAD(P)-dependent dehydrogenase (short-subunit alcohol dehydrogenase family)